MHGEWNTIITTIVSAVIVGSIPLGVKYFNKQFATIRDTALEAKETAERVNRHNRKNKKQFKIMQDNQQALIQRLEEITRKVSEDK